MTFLVNLPLLPKKVCFPIERRSILQIQIGEKFFPPMKKEDLTNFVEFYIMKIERLKF